MEKEFLEALFKTPFVFWVCPNGCKSKVDWNHDKDRSFAICKKCGRTSKDELQNGEETTGRGRDD